MSESVRFWRPILYLAIPALLAIFGLLLFPANGRAVYSVPTDCYDGCHTGQEWVILPQAFQESDMNTRFVYSGPGAWPNLSPDCQQGGCHEIVNQTTGRPNLLNQHIGRSTTTFPGGMTCASCHHGYFGSKLQQADIAYAIYEWVEDCVTCHKSYTDHEPRHDTSYVGSQAVDCTKCHSTVSGSTDNLWNWHIDRNTTSYPSGMECNSCHNYSGSKLVKANIDSAISSANKNCNGCHSTTMHNLDPNTEHRTNFLGDTSCQVCHKASRTAKDNQANLQDLHVGKKTTSYSNGMTCNSCHDYTGSKLILPRINNAINSGVNGNTRCDACHSIGADVHLTPHDTGYLEEDKLVDCTACHPMKSDITGQPNLRNWHMGRKTTSFPDGMDCTSCHDYKGTKLNKSTIKEAISNEDTNCNACHLETMHALDPNSSHRSRFMVSADFCTKCHLPSRARKDKQANLQDYHLSKKTATYKKGMTCNSCHRYKGNKLNKSKVKKAISKGGYGGVPSTKCASCHNLKRVLRHEIGHNTKYDSDFWPDNLNPDCRKCHSMSSSTEGNEGNPNLWVWHLERKTTTYVKGMVCESCHDYKGDKLSKADINKAIEAGDTDCISCHKDKIDIAHERKHDTSYIENPLVDCSTCHEMISSVTGNANLWIWHLNRQTTTYNAAEGYIEGMSCNSCHDYQGNKLSLMDIQTAIDNSNTNCDTCHEQTMHQLDPNADHRTDFMGQPEKCIYCHPYGRNKKDTKYNLQDLHLGKKTTSYPQGMNCNSCHSYKGKKLKKSMIAASIARGGYDGEPYTRCDGCHTEVGPHDWFNKGKNEGSGKNKKISKKIILDEDKGFFSTTAGKTFAAVGGVVLTLGTIGLAILFFKHPPPYFPHPIRFIKRHL